MAEAAIAGLWLAAIDEVRTRGDSCGGEVTCVVRGCPVGLGSPVFDKLEAELAKAIMSLPATKVGQGAVAERVFFKEKG
jgi:chorismate synthase